MLLTVKTNQSYRKFFPPKTLCALQNLSHDIHVSFDWTSFALSPLTIKILTKFDGIIIFSETSKLEWDCRFILRYIIFTNTDNLQVCTKTSITSCHHSQSLSIIQDGDYCQKLTSICNYLWDLNVLCDTNATSLPMK